MTPLRYFKIGDRTFRHVIFTEEDDRVELLDDETQETLLIYTASCEIVAPEGRIGDFTMEGDKWVSYHGPLRTRRVYDFRGPENLLDSEVEFSKHYLSELARKEAPIESEGGHCD